MKLLFTFFYCIVFTVVLNAQWVQTRGPYAGRTTAMITVGNNIYAGHRDYSGTDGRIYRSSNQGLDWVAADGGIFYEFAIVHQFANIGETILAPANYLYRTTNQGNTWEIKDAGLFAQAISVEAVGATFWAGTDGGGVFKSTNLGENWIPMNTGLIGTVIVYDIAQLNNYLFLATEGGGGPARLYRSANNGSSWELANNGLPLGTNPHKFAVNGTTLFVSTEGDFAQYEYGLYKSVDSGNTWTPANNGLPQILYGNTGEIFAHNNSVYVSTTYPGNNSRVFKSTDNGNSFLPASDGLRNGNEVLSYTVAGNYLFAGCGNYSAVFRSANEGTTWEEARKGLANSAVFSLMDHNGRLYAGAQEGLFYSADFGENWTEMQNGLPYGLPVVTMEKNGTNIYLGSDQYGVFRSTDNGNTWTQINSGLNATFAEYINDLLSYNGALYVGTWDGLYKSVNNGDTWTLLDAGLPADVNAQTITQSNGILFVGTVLSGIYKSVNNGASWSPASTGLTTYSMTVNNLMTVGAVIFAATESGVYRSTDQGLSWQLNPTLNGGPFKTLTEGNGILYASQHGPTVLTGYGLFRSLDNGITWETFNDGMNPGSSVRELLVYGNILFGATDTRSVWGRPVAGPVPVTFSNFTGKRSGSKNQLDWTTLSEQNNWGFEIQRSTDGINFSGIAFVNSKAVNSNSSLPLHYRYVDEYPAARNNWYRLNQLDHDNRSSLSNTVLIKNSTESFVAGLPYPNPLRSSLNIDISSPTPENIQIKLFDIKGSVVMQGSFQFTQGDHTLQMNVNGLMPGTYLFQLINSSGSRISGKLLKQ